MKITIGGLPGSGKSTVGKYLAKELEYDFKSMGSIRRELAQKRGLSISEYNDLPENTDKETDDYQKDLGKNKNDFIVEGRLSFHFIPDSFKIYFDCDLRVAAERIFKDNRASEKNSETVEQTLADLNERIDNDRRRYEEHYKVNAYDPSKFDYVVDTTNLTLDEVKAKLLAKIKEKLKLV